jgi:hypothetical protein
MNRASQFRILAGAIASVFLGASAFAECVEVTTPKALDRNVEITMVRKDQPLVHAEAWIYRSGVAAQADLWSQRVTTDEKGTVTLRGLHPGYYSLVALVEGSPAEAGILWISEASTSSVLHGVSSLKIEVPSPRTGVVTATIAQGRGVVLDPSGALVPSAQIYVEKIGDSGERKAVKSDARGEFEFADAEGDYLITVRVTGFRTRFLKVRIAPKDETAAKELKVMVQLGQC